jgi:putative flippase GtrA
MENGIIDQKETISAVSIEPSKQTLSSLIHSCVHGTEDVVIGSVCIKRKHVNECWGLFKYGIVGGSSLAMHTGMYHMLSRYLWIQGPRTMQYVVTLIIASLYNFTLHRIWTFSMQGYSHGMAARYVCVILSSMGIQSIVFHIGVTILGIYDYYVFAVSVVFAALFQYFGHRFVTFNKKFEKTRESVA